MLKLKTQEIAITFSFNIRIYDMNSKWDGMSAGQNSNAEPIRYSPGQGKIKTPRKYYYYKHYNNSKTAITANGEKKKTLCSNAYSVKILPIITQMRDERVSIFSVCFFLLFFFFIDNGAIWIENEPLLEKLDHNTMLLTAMVIIWLVVCTLYCLKLPEGVENMGYN